MKEMQIAFDNGVKVFIKQVQQQADSERIADIAIEMASDNKYIAMALVNDLSEHYCNDVEMVKACNDALEVLLANY